MTNGATIPQPRDENGRFVSIDEHINRIFYEKQVALDQRFAASEMALKHAREHIESIFEEHRIAHAQQHIATEEAVKQAREVIDSRLEKLNELRAEVQEDRGRYVTKEGMEPRIRTLEDSALKAATAEEVKQVRSGVNRATATAIVATLIALANALVRGLA